MGMLGFVLVATTFPMITEALANEKVSVGPPYYAAWMQPLGLLMFLLMGIGTLFGWKKTSNDALKRAFIWPTVSFVVAVALHVLLGAKLGFPAVVWGDAIYPGALGSALRAFNAFTPVLGFALAVFNTAIIVQEFVLLFRARARSGAGKDVPRILYWLGGLPGFLYTLVTLSPQSRRRYGGYIVHFGIVLMFLGFAGKSWNVDKETTMVPGQTFETQGYTLHYVGPRMEVDNAKRMVFADIRVTKGGKEVGQLSPAKFIYKKMPESPTTEVSMLHSVRDDLYLVIGMINPQTKQASLQVHVNPLVSWIWVGCLVLIAGSIICMWPQLEPNESRVWAFARGGAAVAASVTLGIGIAILPAPAMAQGAGVSSLHSGTVKIENDKERALFSSLRCMCGTCARELLSSCGCNVAEDTRTELRAKLAAGETKEQITEEYVREYGPEALAVPPNTGALKAIWALPAAAVCAGGVGLFFMMRRLRKANDGGSGDASKPAGARAGGKTETTRDEYDARLDEELRDLDD
jgi:cytochrome c-type biogenesis protein CcmF